MFRTHRNPCSSDVIADTIKEVLDKVPFHPFRVSLSSGESYKVASPHMVALMKSKVFISLPNESWAFVSYLRIVALEAIANGHPRTGPRRRPRR